MSSANKLLLPPAQVCCSLFFLEVVLDNFSKNSHFCPDMANLPYENDEKGADRTCAKDQDQVVVRPRYFNLLINCFRAYSLWVLRMMGCGGVC
jgi:hypothetical protein